MSSREKRAAFAAMVQQQHERRQAQYTAEREAAATVKPEDQERRLGDLFRDAFVPSNEPVRYERQEHHRQNVWDNALHLASDDDVPSPPVAPPAVVPDPLPPEETRARQIAIVGSADDLFTAMEQRLSTTPEAVQPSPDALLRRAFRELPGAQREALAAIVEAEDYALPGYFASRGFGDDYAAVLVGTALARRFSDAARLDPTITPAAMLQAMLSQAS